jgi:hypothetical protein
MISQIAEELYQAVENLCSHGMAETVRIITFSMKKK